ncbi:glycine cleavage system aminomethyltransferase GcvT [Microbacterium sp.]|uniref:glycine cleavage system aminomethyltransferase GcvT n=1 Tax=Microbacterium sp. TaxID=51671 RepID=UPI003A8BC024
MTRTTPLHDRHVALGATFTDFGGWSMPVRYTSDLAEHHAVRTAAGLFDISHMAEFLVEGADIGAYLDAALAGPLSTLSDDQAKYSLLLAEDGGTLDDLIVYRDSATRYVVVANAGNRDVVATALTARAEGFDVTVHDATDELALLAVQGPVSADVLRGAVGLHVDDLDVRFYRKTRGTFAADADATPAVVHIARTGYTGEDGFELYVHRDLAPALWDALLDAGRPLGLIPAGLAARDTLRLEAGMPLYGHELGAGVHPAQVGLARLQRRGTAAEADAPVLVGLVAEGRRAGRAGYAVLDARGTRVGEVTSGALSPTLGHPIAMAFVHPSASAAGTELLLDVRGTHVPASVIPLPFYRRTS